MGRSKRGTPGVDPVRRFPYYKIQVWDDRTCAWKDIQKKFPTLAALRAHATEKLSRQAITRIVVVEDYGRRRIDENLDAFA